MKYNSFEDMMVWQKAMELATRIYKLTEKFPKKEDYGLTSQIRRSA
ncbi:four helix bundle protein [Candidatus Poribacteria bacterium]|nr:four helix bundle protein [Candidatus Poribacteria bacterium]